MEWSIPTLNRECDRTVSQHLPEYCKILQDNICTYLCPDGSQRRAPSIIKNCKSRLWVDPGTGLRKHFLQMQALLQHRTSGKSLPKDTPVLQTLKGHMVDGSPSWTLYHFKWGASKIRGLIKTSAGKHFRRNQGKHRVTYRRSSSRSLYSNNGKLGQTLGGFHPRTSLYNFSIIIRVEASHKKVLRSNHYPTWIRRA